MSKFLRGAKTAVRQEMEPQSTQNTQMDADEAEVNRLSGRCISYAQPCLRIKHVVGLCDALA